MMSLSNMMEIITKDSVDFSEANCSALGAQSRSSTSHSVRSDSQLSLECLPPEVPHYTSSVLPPPQSPPRYRPSSSTSGPTSPHKSDENHTPIPHHSWSDGNTCKEETTYSQMLYDRIQQLSHKLHTELRPFQDATQKESDSFSSRHDEDCTDDASNLISVHSSKQSADVREDISSRNSTLVDEESLSTSDEDGLREDSDDKDSTSHALVVYSGSELNKSHVSNTEEQGQLREDLEHIEAALGGDGDADGNPQQRSSGKIGGGDERTLPTSDINPKLYKALEKMRKLDERLANITKKEREVKRQRKLLEQQLEDMDCPSEARSEGHSSTALVAIDDYEESISTSPVFVTHLDDNSSSADVHVRPTRTRSTSTGKDGSSSTEEKNEGATKEKQKKGHGQQEESAQGTNFIKRNIELASDAGALVSMTESEKKRLEELLCDDNELEDPYSGPKVVGAIEGEGFSYSKEDLDKMSHIDSRLQLMIAPSDWESICSSTSRNTTPASLLPQHSTQSHSHYTLDTNSLDGDKEGSLSFEPSVSSDVVEEAKHIVPGEEVLHHFQMSREESKRLKDIEERLLAIREEKERIQQEVIPLPVTDLQSLLEQCTRELQASPSYDRTASQSSDGSVTKLVNYEGEADIGH